MQQNDSMTVGQPDGGGLDLDEIQRAHQADRYGTHDAQALLAECRRLRAVVATMATDCERVITQRDSLRAELAAQRALRDREVDGLRVENERLRAELEGVKP